jgi:GNAT superfamily N-acetyltransferase
MSLRVVPLEPGLWDAWQRLFEECASGCYCRYWHFPGTKNEWLARLASSPETNAEEQRACLAGGDESAEGLVALDADAVVGWMKVAPVRVLGKLLRLSVYRASAPAVAGDTLAIACVLVRPSHRRRGVAGALLDGAIALARSRGVRAVDAFPHVVADVARSDEELWMGPPSIFARRGWRSLGGDEAYPYLRLDLEGSGQMSER